MNGVPEPPAAPTEDTLTAPSGQEDVLGRRITAALIDLALLGGLFIVVALAIGESTVEGGSVSLALDGWPAVVYFALVLLYYFALEAAIGQTLGKLLLGLRVVRADGRPPSAAAIALRTVLRIVDWLPLFYLAGFITMMATGQRRLRLGDLAAKTLLARTLPVRRRSLAWSPAAFLVLLIVSLSIYRAADSAGGNNTSTATIVLGNLRLPPTDALLLRDDFSDASSGWNVDRDRDSSLGYVNGRYRMTEETAGQTVTWVDLYRASDAISITAVLRQAAGGTGDELGVVCVKSESVIRSSIQGYAFGIGPSDGYVAVRRILGAKDRQTFVERYRDDAIKPRGEVNRIRVDCFGARERTPARLTLYANGKLVALATVPEGFKRFDGVAVFVYSDAGGTTALFDDLVVHELKPATRS